MKTLSWIIAGLLALTSVTIVSADDDAGWYAGISANRVSADFEDDNDVDFDDSDTAFGLRGGYMFTDMVGVEVGYVDLGAFEADGDRPGNRIDLDADAYNVALVLNWSVHDQIDLYGKLGAYYLDVESDSTIAGFRLGRDDTETEPYGAIGIEWDLGKINFFSEFAYVDTDVNDLGLDIISAGVKYEF